MSTLKEIRARLNAATPGPWKFPHRDYPHVVMTKTGCLWNPVTGKINKPADAEFIAHAPEDVSRLLDALEAVEKLHQPDEDTGKCDECTPAKYSILSVPWPCPTVKAIREALEIQP